MLKKSKCTTCIDLKKKSLWTVKVKNQKRSVFQVQIHTYIAFDLSLVRPPSLRLADVLWFVLVKRVEMQFDTKLSTIHQSQSGYIVTLVTGQCWGWRLCRCLAFEMKTPTRDGRVYDNEDDGDDDDGAWGE